MGLHWLHVFGSVIVFFFLPFFLDWNYNTFGQWGLLQSVTPVSFWHDSFNLWKNNQLSQAQLVPSLSQTSNKPFLQGVLVLLVGNGVGNYNLGSRSTHYSRNYIVLEPFWWIDLENVYIKKPQTLQFRCIFNLDLVIQCFNLFLIIVSFFSNSDNFYFSSCILSLCPIHLDI